MFELLKLRLNVSDCWPHRHMPCLCTESIDFCVLQAQIPHALWGRIRLGADAAIPVFPHDLLSRVTREVVLPQTDSLALSDEVIKSLLFAVMAYLLAQQQNLRFLALEPSKLTHHILEMVKVITTPLNFLAFCLSLTFAAVVDVDASNVGGGDHSWREHH